jgi:hypothetical protein
MQHDIEFTSTITLKKETWKSEVRLKIYNFRKICVTKRVNYISKLILVNINQFQKNISEKRLI